MATEAFVNNKVQESGLSGDVPNITYLSPTSANSVVSFTVAGTHSFVLPSYVKQIKVTTVGGGGSGNRTGCNQGWCYWGGGGGMITENVAITIGSSKQLSLVVGKGGVSPYNYSATGGSGGNSYVVYAGKTYALSKGGSGGRSYGYDGASFNGYAGGPGGGNGGLWGSYPPTKGKYGAVYIYNGDSRYYAGGGGSWGNGAGTNSNREYVAPGIGGGGQYGIGSGSHNTGGGAGAVFINY